MIQNEFLVTLDWLVRVGDFKTARELAKSIARLFPNSDTNPQAMNFLCSLFFRTGAYNDATLLARKILSLQPKNELAAFKLAECLNRSGGQRESEYIFYSLNESKNNLVELKIELLLSLFLQNKLDLFQQVLQELTSIPNLTERQKDDIFFWLGWCEVRKGNFQQGILGLTHGRDRSLWGTSQWLANPKLQLSTQTELKGKNILIFGEGDLGNEILGLRFGKLLQDRRAKVIWVTQYPEISFFSRVETIEQIISYKNINTIPFDYWAFSSDLPALLQLKEKDIPTDPYINLDASVKKHGQIKILENSQRQRNIGVFLEGDGPFPFAEKWYLTEDFISELSKIKNLNIYLLDQKNRPTQVELPSNFFNWGSDISGWDEFSGLIANLDLVITPGNSVAHLAGALGIPTWVICPTNSNYVWAYPNGFTPWYPKARLFTYDKSNLGKKLTDELRDQFIEVEKALEINSEISI